MTDIAWRCPLQEPPPLRVNILILTRFGTLIVGKWEWDAHHIGWLPKPTVPEFISERIGKYQEDWLKK